MRSLCRLVSNSRSRVCKRSRSSPPSSRRSTMDSVRADDLLLACCGELPESDAEGSVGVSYLWFLNEDMSVQGAEGEMNLEKTA